jgi:TRAP transporter TAXI family solute receptor
MRATSRITGLVALLLLTVQFACSRGPDDAVLSADLQSRLDAGFEQELFSVQGFRRTGSAPFTDLESGASGLYVYYDTELHFLRDYSLTSWRGLNLGTLAFVVGATEQGVQGFEARGNLQGDALRVHGRLAYERVDGAWQVVDDVSQPTPTEGAAPVTLEGRGPLAVMGGVRDLVAREPATERGTREAAIVDELRRATSRVDLRFAQLDGRITLGSGKAPGTYQAFGAAFARFAESRGLPLHAYPSEGSVENGFRLQNQLLSFGIIQSDVAETLFQGWIEENQLPQPDLRSLASLWPEAIHVVTLEGSGIRTLDDLRGRRLALGQPGSGSRFSAFRIGDAAGIPHSELEELREIRLRDAIADLEEGQIDAFFVTEAVPAPSLQALARRRRDVRFVPIDASIVEQLSRRHFAYYPITVPARTYPGQEQPFQTVGMAAVLLTNRTTPDAQVEHVLELLLDGAGALSKDYYRAGFISADTVRLGIAVPLHPAAERFYRERSGRMDDSSTEAP